MEDQDHQACLDFLLKTVHYELKGMEQVQMTFNSMQLMLLGLTLII